jgi:hypothetical protein
VHGGYYSIIGRCLGSKEFLCRFLETGAFEEGARLDQIDESAFSTDGLKSIVILSSLVVLGEMRFADCGSPESVIF